MDLTYTTKSGGSKKAIRVPFNPPLAGYEDVKGRLLQMKVDAEEALGMVRPPPLPSLPSSLKCLSHTGEKPNNRLLRIPSLRMEDHTPHHRTPLHDLRARPRVRTIQPRMPHRRPHPRRVAVVGPHRHLGVLGRVPRCRVHLYVFALQEASDASRPHCESALCFVCVGGEGADVFGGVGFVFVDDVGVWVPCVHGLSQARTGGEDR